MAENLVEMRDLVKQFPVKGGLLQREIATVNAVAGVDLDIPKGEAIASASPKAFSSAPPTSN